MILRTLQNDIIPDCEFFIYDDDGINESNINRCKYNGKILPIIVTTSVLDKYNMVLCPDFTFSFYPEGFVKNNETMCKKIVDIQEKTEFTKKINKLVWRGSGNNGYRSQYLKSDENYDIVSVLNHVDGRGSEGSAYKSLNGLSREEKANININYISMGMKGMI